MKLMNALSVDAIKGVGKAFSRLFTTRQKRSRKSLKASGRLLALADSVTLFHSQDDVSFASIIVEKDQKQHIETWPVESKGFREWLRYQFYKSEQSGIDGKALKEATATLAAKGRFGEKKIHVYRRVARCGNTVYLDLCNDEWEIIQITSEGWSFVNVDEIPVRFYRTPTMKSLPTPKTGSVETLRGFLNLPKGDDDAWTLILTWITSGLAGISPYVVLALTGEQGSAKSSAARVLRQFMDPNVEPLDSPPRNEVDLMISAKQSGMVALDNISKIQPWLSNALCRLSTGAGLRKRSLFTNDDEHVIRACVPVLITSISDEISRSDLIDRAMIIDLPRMEGDRLTEKELKASVEAAGPGILGGLLDVVAAGLLNRNHGCSTSLPRMSDFADWGIALEMGLGWEKGRFLSAYRRNINESSTLPLESLFAKALIQYADAGNCNKVSCTEILRQLNDQRVDGDVKDSSWPTSAVCLGKKIKELAPNLRNLGYEVDPGRTKKKRLITISSPPTESESESDSDAWSSAVAGWNGIGKDSLLENPVSSRK